MLPRYHDPSRMDGPSGQIRPRCPCHAHDGSGAAAKITTGCARPRSVGHGAGPHRRHRRAVQSRRDDGDALCPAACRRRARAMPMCRAASRDQPRRAALIDALMQGPQADEVRRRAGATRRAGGRAAATRPRRKAAATRVEFLHAGAGRGLMEQRLPAASPIRRDESARAFRAAMQAMALPGNDPDRHRRRAACAVSVAAAPAAADASTDGTTPVLLTATRRPRCATGSPSTPARRWPHTGRGRLCRRRVGGSGPLDRLSRRARRTIPTARPR